MAHSPIMVGRGIGQRTTRGRHWAVRLGGATVLVLGLLAPIRALPAGAAGPTFVTTVAGTGSPGSSGDGGPPQLATLNTPWHVVKDPQGNTYFPEFGGNIVRKIDASGVISTIAGTGEAGFSGDGGPATAATFNGPQGIARDAAGNLYILDVFNNRVRKIDTNGIITTVAGTGDGAFGGDGGPATQAQLNWPTGAGFDAAGNLYVAELQNARIRKIDTNGIITTVVGGGSPPDDLGDGGQATAARLLWPNDVDFDPAGNLLVVDNRDHRIRSVDPSGIITTVAGNGTGGFSGDGGPATAAQLNTPTALDVDGAGVLYIADSSNQRIRRVAAGIITTIAGNGDTGFSGDNGPALEASFNYPSGIEVEVDGRVLVADTLNHRLRQLGPDLLSITKTGAPDAVTAGQELTYTLTVTNNGSETASGVEVTDPLPGSATFVSADVSQGSCSEATGTVSCELGDLASGASATVTIVVVPTEPAIITNTASVVADEPDPLPGNNSASAATHVSTVDLSVTKSADPATSGQPFSYTLDVTNAGPTGATGVALTDALPAEVSFVSAVPTQGTCAPGPGVVNCQLGALAPGASASVTIGVIAPSEPGSILTNTAEVTSAAEVELDPSNNTASVSTQVSAVGCGLVITQNTTLTADVGPCAADGVIIGKDGVTLDLGGYRIFGFPGPGDGTATGIRLPNRNRVLIQNGAVSDFDAGVFINSGRSNTVRDMTIRDNVGPDDIFTALLGDGIAIFDSGFNRILDNVLTGNGVFDGIGVFGQTADGNVIDRNTVENTVGPASGGSAGQGIIVNGAEAVDSVALITGTRIRDNVVRGNGSAGISNVNNAEARVERNIVEGNGLTNNNGNGIGVQVGIGSPSTLTHVLVKDNEVRGNGFDGIEVTNRAHANRIIDNISTDNGRRFEGELAGVVWFDLIDNNPNCDSNVWRGNTWGSARYRPACVTTGGTGPNPPAAAASNEPSFASTADAPAEEEFPPFRQAPPL